MARVAVLMAEGYEEGETLTIVDLLRRADIDCHTFSFKDEFVKGMHNMYIKADKIFGKEIKESQNIPIQQDTKLILNELKTAYRNAALQWDVDAIDRYLNEKGL